MHQSQKIHGDMLIGDILAAYPEAAQIMEDFGLHCTTCSVNAYEPLRAGAMGHGLEEEIVDELMSRLNDMANAKKNQADPDGLFVTKRAAFKIGEFAKSEEKEGWALKITAHPNEAGKEPAYAMDFVEKASDKDKSFEFDDVTLVLDQESFKLLKGSDIDYLQTKFGEGFKIINPNFQKGGCCGGGGCGSGGSGGCGGGSCGCSH